MSEALHLREYQTEAISAVFAAWESGMQAPAVVLPTGLGKTVIFSHLAAKFVEQRHQRVVVLVHRDELADQAIAKIRAVAPHLHVGKVKAEANETHADVVVCSVQTVSRPNRLAQLTNPAVRPRLSSIGLVIVDECHHAAADSYKTILDRLVFSKNASEAVCVGFTATLARGDEVGLGDVWQDVVYTKSVLWGISKGFLSDVRGKAVTVSGLDLTGVKRSRGDYQGGDLGSALEESDLSDVLPEAYREHAGERPGVVFTPTVATAQGVAESFNNAGIRTAVITGETPRDERRRIYTDYRTGGIQVLSNCMVLTEGFDAPWASCAVIARPTQSQPLYVQMVGRVLRPWPGKKDALILDVTGVGGKLATLIDLSSGDVQSLRDEESLAEAFLREEDEKGCVPQKSNELAFNLRTKDLDLFASSSQSWLTTYAGVMFIPVGDGEVFLWSTENEAWDVCYAPKSGKWQRLRKGLPLGTAMAWAETEAEDRMPFNTGRSASWRRKPASEKQIGLARGLGVVVEEGVKSGEIGNLISVEFASRKFDRYARKSQR